MKPVQARRVSNTTIGICALQDSSVQFTFAWDGDLKVEAVGLPFHISASLEMHINVVTIALTCVGRWPRIVRCDNPAVEIVKIGRIFAFVSVRCVAMDDAAMTVRQTARGKQVFEMRGN